MTNRTKKAMQFSSGFDYVKLNKRTKQNKPFN